MRPIPQRAARVSRDEHHSPRSRNLPRRSLNHNRTLPGECARSVDMAHLRPTAGSAQLALVDRACQRGRVPLASCFVPMTHRTAPRHARNPDLAVVLERAHRRNGVCPDPLPRRFVDLLKRRHCERDVPADHFPILLGRFRHEFNADVPLDNVAQPRAHVQSTDIGPPAIDAPTEHEALPATSAECPDLDRVARRLEDWLHR